MTRVHATHRVLLNVFVLVSIVSFPWWVTVAAIVALLALFDAVEVLVWGLFMDSLYGVAFLLFPVPLLFTMLFTFFLLAALYIKRRLII